ncbi:hypothetical protein N7527_008431 [Penicillium freii]|nr:hypothetical protein N7527_008431 [Penicillium freii]
MHRRFLVDSGYILVGYKLEKGTSAPDITMIKEFIVVLLAFYKKMSSTRWKNYGDCYAGMCGEVFQ